METMILEIAQIDVKPGSEAEFEAGIERASAIFEAAKGCRSFEVRRSVEKPQRYRLLIDLGRALEPMPEALKTDATLVRGCSASVWVYPTRLGDGRLHFLADSNAAITKGIIALVLLWLRAYKGSLHARSALAHHLQHTALSRPAFEVLQREHAGFDGGSWCSCGGVGFLA